MSSRCRYENVSNSSRCGRKDRPVSTALLFVTAATEGLGSRSNASAMFRQRFGDSRCDTLSMPRPCSRASTDLGRAEDQVESGRQRARVSQSVCCTAPSVDRIVIDGPCLFVYTLVLSTIPRDRLCVTRFAILGFRAPQQKDLIRATDCDSTRGPSLPVCS